MRIALLAAFAAVPALVPRPSADAPMRDESQLVFHAVLEGLYADGVANDVVDAMLERDAQTGWPLYFVYACPLCMPALNAVTLYRSRPRFLGDKLERDTFGRGLPDEVRAALLSPDPVARAEALRERVTTWIGRRIRSMRLDENERAALSRTLEGMREKGLAMMEGYMRDPRTAIYGHMQFCPWCDGANEAMRY